MTIAIFLFDGITALDAIGPYESLARIADSEIVFVASGRRAMRRGGGATNAGALTVANYELRAGGEPSGHSGN